MYRSQGWRVNLAQVSQPHRRWVNEAVAAVLAKKSATMAAHRCYSWPLNGMAFPMPGRMSPVHKQMPLSETGLSQGAGWDDEIHFNTQLSSQWDSLVHWQHQPSGLAYNGTTVTKEALAAPRTADNKMPTLDHWHAVGGLVARGVLIDFKAWAEDRARAEGKEGADAICHPLEGHRITVEQVETIARDQGVELRPGDVLVIRTGLTEVMQAPTPEDMAKLQNGRIAGMHGVLETVRWLWNRHFAAVAGDTWAFEALLPLAEDGSPGKPEDLGKPTPSTLRTHDSSWSVP